MFNCLNKKNNNYKDYIVLSIIAQIMKTNIPNIILVSYHIIYCICFCRGDSYRIILYAITTLNNIMTLMTVILVDERKQCSAFNECHKEYFTSSQLPLKIKILKCQPDDDDVVIN